MPEDTVCGESAVHILARAVPSVMHLANSGVVRNMKIPEQMIHGIYRVRTQEMTHGNPAIATVPDFPRNRPVALDPASIPGPPLGNLLTSPLPAGKKISVKIFMKSIAVDIRGW
jgi:hypothetical protein